MSTMYNLLHIPLCTVMLILIFNSTAYCHAHSFIFYIVFFISYFSFILSYVYFPCVVFFFFQYLHCPWSGPDSHFTAGYTVSV